MQHGCRKIIKLTLAGYLALFVFFIGGMLLSNHLSSFVGTIYMLSMLCFALFYKANKKHYQPKRKRKPKRT